MSSILVGKCEPGNLYQVWDADAASEIEFEAIVVRALGCVYSDYHCIVFGGGFRLNEETYKPDLALVARDYSHWFIIEVELSSHSLTRHVLPQVRAFQYGAAQKDCVGILSREINLPREQVTTFLNAVPRSVAVVANKRHREWEIALGSLEVQLLTVAAFRSANGQEALEIDGQLEVRQEHLGFGIFSAIDGTLRFPRGLKLLDGNVMISDPSGASSMWNVKRDASFAWVSKMIGMPDYPHGSHIQIVRTFGGKLSIKQSSNG